MEEEGGPSIFGYEYCAENPGSNGPSPPIREPPTSVSEQHWHSSSAISLVDGAFHLHNATVPKSPAMNAIPGARQRPVSITTRVEVPVNTASKSPSEALTTCIPNTIGPMMRPLSLSSQPFLSELLALLPEYRAAALLVDTYFDRVHWFMLIFHQDEFRERWRELYKRIENQTVESYNDVGFISTFLTVIGIASLYLGQHRKNLFNTYNIDSDNLRERIFYTIKVRLLDIIALGSLNAVQTCILLGTYYLFHGSPELAWPVCGCGLRIAQALNLHRTIQCGSQDQMLSQASQQSRKETRKRCWWAIYEIETFCSMSYGYPPSIRDDDCDVEPLDPSARSHAGQSPMSFDEPLRCETTLLSYKYFMSKLSVITKAALSELYRVGESFAGPTRVSSSRPSNLTCLIQNVTGLDARLQSWHSEIPPKLQLRNDSVPDVSYNSLEELDKDVGASGPLFENHVYKLQALALSLAYENARILVHRPLLSYKLTKKPRGNGASKNKGSRSFKQDPFSLSLEACCKAALRTCDIIVSPIAGLVTATYAAAFVAIHTFTAGVTLAILCSIDPLNPQSNEAKIGLRRLMAIQKKLTDKAPLASQGLDILQRLTKLMLDKEYADMLDISYGRPAPNPDSRTNDIPQEHLDSQGNISPSLQVQSLQNSTHFNYTQGSQETSSVAENKMSFLPSGDFTYQTNFEREASFECIEDSAMSEALYDLDRALTGYTSLPGFGYNAGPFDSTSNFDELENCFLAPEQTWIWGLENFPQNE